MILLLPGAVTLVTALVAFLFNTNPTPLSPLIFLLSCGGIFFPLFLSLFTLSLSSSLIPDGKYQIQLFLDSISCLLPIAFIPCAFSVAMRNFVVGSFWDGLDYQFWLQIWYLFLLVPPFFHCLPGVFLTDFFLNFGSHQLLYTFLPFIFSRIFFHPFPRQLIFYFPPFAFTVFDNVDCCRTYFASILFLLVLSPLVFFDGWGSSIHLLGSILQLLIVFLRDFRFSLFFALVVWMNSEDLSRFPDDVFRLCQRLLIPEHDSWMMIPEDGFGFQMISKDCFKE